MCRVFHREAEIDNVTIGTLTCAECRIEKLRLIMLLLAHRCVHSVAEGTIGDVLCAVSFNRRAA